MKTLQNIRSAGHSSLTQAGGSAAEKKKREKNYIIKKSRKRDKEHN